MITVIIPALNEENAIVHVLSAIPKEVSEVIVVDNGSKDQTSAEAKRLGATLLYEPRRGYGSACLRGLEYLSKKQSPPQIVVFIDADFADNPKEMPLLWRPILRDETDLVIGSRVLGQCEKGALTLPQRLGNRLATFLLHIFYGGNFTDLGPFRAIRYTTLQTLSMQDRDYGWTIEMQIKALKQGVRYVEIPVSYKKRIGFSKISGTVKGVFSAGYKIIKTIIQHF